MRKLVVTMALVMSACGARAQWVMQESHSTASFRGVDYVGSGVAWVSGTRGTVLKTVDMGKTWTACAVPEGAEKLDFRGVQAFDARTAIVMSSGPGDASRLYKTVDGCATWKLVFSNPDKDGFWDALKMSRSKLGFLIGDPVDESFRLFFTKDEGETWTPVMEKKLVAFGKKPGIFAASNSSLLVLPPKLYLVFGGDAAQSLIVDLEPKSVASCKDCTDSVYMKDALAVGDSSGGFSLATNADPTALTFVAVGGNYQKPDETIGTASYLVTPDKQGAAWKAASTPPGGYRSSVAYSRSAKAWITVGPNGTDLSLDDGKNWKTLTPGSEDATGIDKNWNALSLPFVVGSKGRIGILRDGVLEAARSPR